MVQLIALFSTVMLPGRRTYPFVAPILLSSSVAASATSLESMNTISYHDLTYNSRNPLRRWAHRTRFAKSISAIDLTEGAKVLDFGCGDGLFLNQLRKSADVELRLTGYEPYMKSLEENEVRTFSDWEDVRATAAKEGDFDVVTSFEVFEHFSADNQRAALARISQVLDRNGPPCDFCAHRDRYPRIGEEYDPQTRTEEQESSVFGDQYPQIRRGAADA